MPRKPHKDQSGNGKGDKGKNKKGRGPGKNIEPIESEELRPVVTIEGATFRREPYKRDKNINNLIGQIVRTLYPGGGVESFKKEWSDNLKEASFYEFTRRYRIHGNVGIEEARRLFEYKANCKLTQNLYEARSAAIRETGSEEFRDWSDSEPYWIRRNDWKLLIKVWCGKPFRDASDRNTNNRLAPGDNVAHATTGSLSIVDYKHKMMSENGGHEPDMEDVYEVTHTKKKTGQLVNEKVKEIKESVREARKKKYGDDPAAYPPWDMELWCDATGGKPHGHYTGMGAAVDPRVPRRSHPVNVPTQMPPPGYVDRDTVRKMIQDLRDESSQREEERYLILRDEFLKREEERERRYFRALREVTRQSRLSWMQETQGRNDGASTSYSGEFVNHHNGHDPSERNVNERAFTSFGASHHRATHHNGQDPSERDVYERASTPFGASHHRANWINADDNGDDSSDEDIVLESSDNEHC